MRKKNYGSVKSIERDERKTETNRYIKREKGLRRERERQKEKEKERHTRS